MGRGDQLPAFEQLVLLAVLALGDHDAYGMNVRQVLRDEAGRNVSVPTVYSALDRLEAKGFVTSRLGEVTPERGGRAKKLFRVERAGVEALRAARQSIDNLWSLAGLEAEPRHG
jgi:PadR family transcriptional regulator, regulatory protein PadR